jgi:hypothetical protein
MAITPGDSGAATRCDRLHLVGQDHPVEHGFADVDDHHCQEATLDHTCCIYCSHRSLLSRIMTGTRT